jgi:hypothetical protein
LKKAVLVAAASLVAVYLGDWTLLHLRGASALGKVPVRTYYAIPEKGNKTDFTPGEDGVEDCARSLFGHDGMDSCWWLSRHADKRVDL